MRLGVPISAQVFAVKKAREEDGSTVLVDLGIKGISCQNLRNGLAQMSALKFITTSYYHDVSPKSGNHRGCRSTCCSRPSSAV